MPDFAKGSLMYSEKILPTAHQGCSCLLHILPVLQQTSEDGGQLNVALYDVQKRFVQRSDRVKGVDLHPTEPWCAFPMLTF